MTAYVKHLGQISEGFGSCRKYVRWFDRHLYSISRYSGNTSFVTFSLIPHGILKKDGLSDELLERYMIDNDTAITLIANCRLTITY